MKKKRYFWMVPEPLVQQFKKKSWGSGEENDSTQKTAARETNRRLVLCIAIFVFLSFSDHVLCYSLRTEYRPTPRTSIAYLVRDTVDWCTCALDTIP